MCKHVGLRSAGAGAYCGGHLAAQLVMTAKAGRTLARKYRNQLRKSLSSARNGKH